MGIPQVHLKGYRADESVLLIYPYFMSSVTIWKHYFIALPYMLAEISLTCTLDEVASKHSGYFT